jgi:hypothetical protein
MAASLFSMEVCLAKYFSVIGDKQSPSLAKSVKLPLSEIIRSVCLAAARYLKVKIASPDKKTNLL